MKSVKKMKDNTFNYSKALELLKEGKKVSCKRWGEDGNVYVSLEEIDHKTKDSLKLLTLVLIDTTRDKAVTFTPSVENQIEDNEVLTEINNYIDNIPDEIDKQNCKESLISTYELIKKYRIVR